MNYLVNELNKGIRVAQLALVAMVVFSSNLSAAEVDSPSLESQWSRSLLLGVGAVPTYFGDDQLQGTALPDVRVSYDDRFEASLFFGAQYSLFRAGSWSAGPALRFDFGRDEREGNPLVIFGSKTADLLGLGDVKGSVEAGGFVAYKGRRWQMGAEMRQGLDGGHEGLVGVLNVKFNGEISVLGRRGFVAIGPELLYADENYNRTYFGITQEQADKTGLSTYRADAGIVRYGMHFDLLVPFNETISLGMFANFDRLGAPAADSPLIIERGSENQYVVGLVVARAF